MSSTIRTNSARVRERFDKHLERKVFAAAREAAQKSRQLEPDVSTFAARAETVAGVVSATVYVPKSDFQAQMLDLGTLGKRTVPLKYPAKRKQTWKGKRTLKKPGKPGLARSGASKTTTVTYHRSRQALASGGITPGYFFIRSKRYGQQVLARSISS